MTLVEKLRSWAQNEEMVDASFTEHGEVCNAAADEIERLREVLQANRQGAQIALDVERAKVERLREAICEFDEALTIAVSTTGEDGLQADERYRLAERALCRIAREGR